MLIADDFYWKDSDLYKFNKFTSKMNIYCSSSGEFTSLNI
jgi:hypothetical protein